MKTSKTTFDYFKSSKISDQNEHRESLEAHLECNEAQLDRQCDDIAWLENLGDDLMKRNIKRSLIIVELLKRSPVENPQSAYGSQIDQAYAAHPWILQHDKGITDLF